MNDLENIPISFSTVSDNNVISLLVYDRFDDRFDDTKNWKMLMSTITSLKDSEIIYEQLFW